MRIKLFNIFLNIRLIFNVEKVPKFVYTLLEDGTYSISARKNVKYDKNLNIPEFYKDKRITEIANSGFKNICFETICIPPSIKKIGDEAFFNTGVKNIYYDSTKQNIYLTFNGSPVGIDDSVECGANCFGNYSDLPSIKTTDLILNSSFKIDCINLNQLGDKIKYDIGYCKENEIRSVGEIKIDSPRVTTIINAKVHGILKDAKFKIIKNGIKKYSFTSKNINVSAPEYNIAPLSGSFPVLLFSLQLKEITKNGSIPTYVALNISKAYDWNNLMYNISYFPNVSKSKALIDGDWKSVKLFVSKYICDLYKANNNSVFNFYFKDLNCEMIIESFICNGVPPNNIKLHILSDGTLTPVTFSYLFGIKENEAKFNPNKKLKVMTDDIQRVLRYFNKKRWDYRKAIKLINYPTVHPGYEGIDCMQDYTFAFYNVFAYSEYQTGKIDPTGNLVDVVRNNEEFSKKILKSCSVTNINELLNNLTLNDKNHFKKMYRYSNNIFNNSKKNNKNFVMILGDTFLTKKNNFYYYTRLTMELFGISETDYYYKSHPGFPISSNPIIKKQFEELIDEGFRLNNINESVPAEIIIFNESSLQVAGPPSTTFCSLRNNKGAALYNTTLLEAKTKYQEFYKNFECFLSVASSELKIKYLFDINDKVFLIEYNDSNEADISTQRNFRKHPIALYNMNKKVLHYFNSKGKEVKK